MPPSSETRTRRATWSRLARAAVGLGSIATLLTLGCRPTPPPDLSDAVALVEGIPIRAEELTAELQRRAGTLDPKLSASEARQSALAELIRHRALLHRARAQGLDRDPETQRRIDRLVASIYLEKHGPDPEKLPLPSDEEIRVAYEKSRSEFATADQYRVGLIFLKRSPKATSEKDLECRRSAERLATDLASKSANPNAFTEAARQYSEDRASRYLGGDVGWVELGRKAYPWPTEVVQAIAKLKTDGELSPLIETPTGFYLLKRLAYQPPGFKPLTEVRDELVHRLVRTRKSSQAEQFEQDLRAGLQIEIREDALARIPLPETRLAQAAPPASPTRTRR